MKLQIFLLALCALIGRGFAADSITIESSNITVANSFYIGGKFSTAAPSPLSIDVQVDGVTQGGSPPLVQSIPGNAQGWSAYISPGSFGVGPHFISVTLLSGATILATESAIVTYNTTSPHVWSRNENSYFSEGSYSISIYYDADTASALFVPGLSNVLVMPTGLYANTANNLQSVTFTLAGDLDGSSESLGFKSGTSAPGGSGAGGSTLGTYNTSTNSITVTANTPATGLSPGSFTSVLQSLIYNNALPAPSPGIRTIYAYATDINGATSSGATSFLTVSKGRPELALSGSFVTPNTSINYNQGAGALAVVANSSIDAQTPAWIHGPYVSSPPVNTANYNPPWLYIMAGTGQLNNYEGQVIDSIDVTLSNTSPGSPALLAGESLAFSFPTEYVYQYDKGHFLIYDGFYDSALYSVSKGPYPMYSARATVVGSTANSKTWRVSVTQDNSYQFATLKQVPAPTVPMPVTIAQNILRSLTYSNSSTNPSGNGASRTISVTATNATTSPTPKTSVARTCSVTIVPTNSTPTAAYAGGGFTLDQNSSYAATSVAVSNFSVSDPDGNNFGATGSLINNPESLIFQASGGTFSISALPTDVSISSGNGTNRLVLLGPVNGSAGALTTVLSLNRVTYTPNLNFSGADTISLTINDNGNSSINQSFGSPLALTATATASVTVTKVNQPPVVTAPTSRTTLSSQNLVMTAISIGDPDVTAATTMQLSISASHGRVSLASTSGLSFSFTDTNGVGVGTGTNDTALVCRGTLANLTLALAELTYVSTVNYYGPDPVLIQVNDLGNSGIRRATYLGGVVSPGGAASSLVTSSTITVGVGFVNALPTIATNASKTVPIGAAVLLQGGTYTASTNYPPAVSRLPTVFATPLPAGAGTIAIAGTNLVALDVETKQASGLTYTINLPVTQGSMTLQRPAVAAVTLIANGQFTQDDLNQGYVSYTHNGALSGDDGFVFTVTDDNATTYPTTAPGGQVNGATSQQIFNLIIDRTKPIAIFGSSTIPIFHEPIPPASAVPVTLDNDPLTRVVNATDPTDFVGANLTGRLTATATIPTTSGVTSDAQDRLTILSQAPLTVTGSQVFYNGVSMGSFVGGQGAPLVVTLSAGVPVQVVAVSELLRHLQFSNPSANPSTLARVITVTVQNGAGQVSTVANKSLNLVPYNNPPVITAPTRPLMTVPGLTVGDTVQATDPDGVLTYSLTGSPPTRGQVTLNATTGAFTYAPAANPNGAGGVLTDQFEVTATDPGIPTNATTKSASQIYQVRITDLGATAPVFASNPPLETVLGRVLTYAPQVTTTGLTAPTLTYSLVGLSPAVNPGLGFDATTGTITWPAAWTLTPAPTADSYQQLGLLVVDTTNQVAAYQPLMLKILLAPHASN